MFAAGTLELTGTDQPAHGIFAPGTEGPAERHIRLMGLDAFTQAMPDPWLRKVDRNSEGSTEGGQGPRFIPAGGETPALA